MQCPSCGEDNPERAKFCLNCGMKLTLVCPQCGTELPPGSKFCLECGTPMDASEERDSASRTKALRRLVPKEFANRLLATRGKVSGERRIVTILFSDIKGSTTMAEGLDPEDVMEIMDGAFDVLIEPIYRYEGTLARLMGDAILAFFGAPIAHEDDPERACRAALEIIEGAREYAKRLEEERGIHGFNVRVGINTGLVVVGEVGSDLRVEYTAMGDIINLASRLESAAKPGSVLISEETHKLIAPLFDAEDLSPAQVKGKAEPVPVYRLLAARETPSKARGIAELESPLVGREAELGALRDAIRRLEAGVGGIVTIVGEAGLGKSRLVAEARRDMRAESLSWVEGRCLSYGTSIAYLLWLDMFRALLRVSRDATPAQVRDALRERVKTLCADEFASVYVYLARLMSLPLEPEAEATLRNLEGEVLKANTFAAMETLIRCATSTFPLVLVCEDLHWADATSLELLERLLVQTDRVPLLLICLFRPERERGCWSIRETAARLYPHRHTDLWLDPLSPSDSGTLLSNLLQMESLVQGFRDRVLSHAEGNPFYVEEIIRSLVDSGAIVRDELSGAWEATKDVADIAIPDTLQGVLLARIDRLQEDTKRVLQMASVIGRIFLHRLLAAIAEEEKELDDHLIALQREQMIRERARLPELEYIFKHHLTQEAAYTGLLKKERRAFHRQVAEALERLFPDRIEEHVGLLAHHWERGGEDERATQYLLKAGDHARALYAHTEAEGFYRKAVSFLRAQGQEELAAKTLMKLGLVHTAAFEPEKARKSYDEAFDLWEPLRGSVELPDSEVPATVLRFAVGEPLGLDPGAIDDDISTFIVAQLFEGLVEIDPDYNVLPAAAARWAVADEGKTYVFRLREGLLWSDGTPLTAGDFEYAWKRNLGLATHSHVANLLYVIENARAFAEGKINDLDKVGVTARDSLTLEVRLEAPTAYLLHLLAHPIAYPLPQWVVERDVQDWTEPGILAGNGPYQLTVWDKGKRLALTRNPFYHRRFPGNAQRVECPIFTEFGPVLDAYATNDLDAVSMIASDPGTIARARAAHGDELVFVPRPSTVYLAFRVDMLPFNDVRIRRAFVHAVDREALAREGFLDQSLSATGGFVPPGMPGHSPRAGLAYDPDQARRLLAEAGYPGGKGFPSISWLHSRGSQDERVSPFLQRAWRENLGLNLEARGVDWATFAERRDRDPAHLTLVGWSADYPDPDSMLRAVFHSTQGINRPGWRNERFDSLVEEAAQVTDQTRRIELYQEADRVLVTEEAVILPLSYVQGRMLVKPWVTLPRIAPVLVRLKNVVVERGGSMEV